MATSTASHNQSSNQVETSQMPTNSIIEEPSKMMDEVLENYSKASICPWFAFDDPILDQ